MKTILASLLLMIVFTVNAQLEKPQESIHFCFNKYEIPEGWSRDGDFAVKGPDCDFSWICF